MDKYEIRCTTDNAWKRVIASAAPTECPDNAGHSIDTNMTVIVCRDVTVGDGTATELTLDELKQMRYTEIDARTVELINEGFSYDSNTFSLSPNAQRNWNSFKFSADEYTWPVEVTLLNHNTYSLASNNNTAFWNAARAAIRGHLNAGRQLKQSVFGASDKAAVDAIVDSR